MNKKKHIDQLFKERFKNFEATPSPQVWENIRATLKEKEDRKAIPLWIKLGGVAALLALMLTVGSSIFNPSINSNTPLITNENTEVKTQDSNNDIIINETKVEKIEVASEDKSTSKDAVKNSSTKTGLKKKTTAPESEIAYENNSPSVSTKKEAIAQNIIEQPKNKPSNVNKAVVEQNINNADTNSLIKKENPISNLNNETETVADVKTKENENIASETAAEETNKRSIFDAVNETNEAIADVSTNSEPDNRWEITPNVGPVYYNSLSEGSSIDPSFSDNPKSGDLNMAYGIQVSYNLNNRLSVRSGISNVNLSYSTTGIELGNGPVAIALKSVNYDARGDVLIAVDKGTLANITPGEGEFGTITPKSTSGEPSINQKLSYYEVPLELKYALVNKKIGVNLIGGFSTLFLGDNEIFVTSGDFSETLGEANNLSSLSFTTNIGLGLDYSFSKKLMFNIEPMFKYQLNTYTESSVDFKPYYIGVYSGLSFKF